MRRAIWIFLLLFATGAASAEVPPACTGHDLLEELKHTDPKAYQATLDEAKAIPNGEAIFWKIESKAQPLPSYLYGTVHLSDARAQALPQEAAKALDGAKVLALELKEAVDPKVLAAATIRNARLIAMPDARNMWDLIPDADEAMVRNAPTMPTGRADAFAAYQPWVAAAALSVPHCEILRQTAGLDALDTVLGKRALAHDIPVVGLETVEEQLSVFAGMPLDLQARYLIETARFSDKLEDNIETLMQLYLTRRLALQLPFSRHAEVMNAESLKVVTFLESELIAKRNLVMQKRARPLIDAGNAFIAVGALHLQGTTGLVALLREAGYSVTPIN